MNKEEINTIKEKIKNFSNDLKQLSLTAVYFKLTNKTENLQVKYNYLFNEFKDIKLGCFVSFYINNKLRGCIGTIEPAFENIIIEIINNSISSAFKDPRFEPISLTEYSYLTNKID
ncbi:MAG: AMMECR1 domain-containing protein, partial [bacterium]